MKKTMIPVALVCAAFSAQGAIHLPNLFSDRAVFQRGKPLPVWGTAEPGETVTVSFNGATAQGKADAAGRWTATLPAQDVLKVGGTMTVAGSVTKDAVKRNDILVGDVWLVSGQSNAEMSFGWGIINGAAEMAMATNYPNIRQTKFNHVTAAVPWKYRACNGAWTACTEKTLRGVTAMGYFFARDINARTGIPIGLLDDNWSGCRIEPFICREGYAAVPSLANRVAEIDRTAQNYTRQMDDFVAAWGRGDHEVVPPSCGNGLAMQHNAMVEPIVRFPIAGALWYQGCSNGGEGAEYAEKLRALVAGWRAKWGYDFPFYIVQLASFTAKTTDAAGGNGYARIRNAQRIAAQTIPKTGLAVAIDIGNASDIHPKNKRDVGERLARWARRDVYGEKNLAVSGPLYKGMKVEGHAIRVSFDHVYEGLMAAEKGPDTPGVAPKPLPLGEDELKGFSIAGADKVWHWAKAEIDGKDVVVSCEGVTDPVAVRYAHRANPMGDCNLYNKAGLPASPFRTDNW